MKTYAMVLFIFLGLTITACGAGLSENDARAIADAAVAKALTAIPPTNTPRSPGTPRPTYTAMVVTEIETIVVTKIVEIPVTQEVEVTRIVEQPITVISTKTPAFTFTPRPANTPISANIPPLPGKPLKKAGSGDSVVDIGWPNIPSVILITGNRAERYFGVTSYGELGIRIDLLVSVTEDYEGIRPLNFPKDEHVTRLKIEATGYWSIVIYPLGAARQLKVPGSIEGEGDEVILIVGAKPDLVTIKGNAAERYFGVMGYNGGRDPLVNVTDPYEGTVILNPNTAVLEIRAVGSWSIDITSR